MKTTLDYALEYIRRGWSVIPLAPRSKAPMTGFPLARHLSGEHRMTAVVAELYWGQCPERGIGIITGRPSGLIVADVDPRNGGDVEGVLSSTPQEAMVALTGGGGIHVYYACPVGQDVRCGKTLYTGVERKGNGGFVVGPPSVHPSGVVYAWR